MFEDFRSLGSSPEGRARRRQSLAAAVVLYGAAFAALVAATATATTYSVTSVDDIFIVTPQLNDPPASAAPAATAEPPATKPLPKPRRPKPPPAPSALPDETPAESNAELTADPDAPPAGATPGNVESGTGRGDEPAPAAIAPPKPAGPTRGPIALDGNREPPRYSSTARRRGVEGVVVVDFEVTATGTVRDVRIVSGAPELAEMALRWVVKWRFKPALRDGKPVAYRKRETIRFRLADP